MGAIFGTPAAPAPPPPPEPPKVSDSEVQARALEERKRRTAAGGRASTILTSGQGVAEGGAAAKTLLGS